MSALNPKIKQLKESNIENTFSTWAIYFFIIVIMVTLSPYNFEFSAKSIFSWRINTFDMFENLFLLFPIGFFLTLSSNKNSTINIIKYTLVGFVFSLCIESSQLFLESRTSQYWDVIANTLSMALGALIGMTLKPLAKKIIITRSSIVKLISTLFALSLLIIIRLMMNNQSFGLFEFSLLFCGSGLLTLIYSHYSLKNNDILAGHSAVTTIIFAFISLFPLLLTNITLFLMLSLFFGLIVPASVFLMSVHHAISYSNKKKIVFFIISPPLMIFSALAITNLITTNSGFATFQFDKLYDINEGRNVGGVIVQVFLLVTITAQLLDYILSSMKKPN